MGHALEDYTSSSFGFGAAAHVSLAPFTKISIVSRDLGEDASICGVAASMGFTPNLTSSLKSPLLAELVPFPLPISSARLTGSHRRAGHCPSIHVDIPIWLLLRCTVQVQEEDEAAGHLQPVQSIH